MWVTDYETELRKKKIEKTKISIRCGRYIKSKQGLRRKKGTWRSWFREEHDGNDGTPTSKTTLEEQVPKGKTVFLFFFSHQQSRWWLSYAYLQLPSPYSRYNPLFLSLSKISIFMPNSTIAMFLFWLILLLWCVFWDLVCLACFKDGNLPHELGFVLQRELISLFVRIVTNWVFSIFFFFFCILLCYENEKLKIWCLNQVFVLRCDAKIWSLKMDFVEWIYTIIFMVSLMWVYKFSEAFGINLTTLSFPSLKWLLSLCPWFADIELGYVILS